MYFEGQCFSAICCEITECNALDINTNAHITLESKERTPRLLITVMIYRVAQKVSHYQVSSFNRIKNRH